MQPSVDVSIVLPAHNEVDLIDHAVEAISQTLKEHGDSFEIIIAEDGSTDGTDVKAAVLAKTLPYVRHIHGEKRLGRGKALNTSFKNSKGKVLFYMDVDLATDLKHLGPLIDAISKEGYDLATGSRMLPESHVKRSFRRGMTSKFYNFMVRLILGSKLRDHQCGFKAFKREPLIPLLDEVEANHWFWDTEILVRAQKKGLKVKEIPVKWDSGKDTKVKLFKDSTSMGWQVLTLWWHLKTQGKKHN
jgi:glycosyltransferase involved in cell wall biosynthesis